MKDVCVHFHHFSLLVLNNFYKKDHTQSSYTAVCFDHFEREVNENCSFTEVVF